MSRNVSSRYDIVAPSVIPLTALPRISIKKYLLLHTGSTTRDEADLRDIAERFVLSIRFGSRSRYVRTEHFHPGLATSMPITTDE